MTNYKVSIISSFYRSDRYLGNFSKALSAFAQGLLGAGVDFEIIIIANEPTEAEKVFGKKFANQSWFKFVEVERESLYASWNRAVIMSTGEICGPWNADDMRYFQSIIEARKLFSQGAELVYFPFKISRYVNIFGKSFLVFKQTIDKQIPVLSNQTRDLFTNSMFYGPHFMFTKELYERVGPFDEQFKIVGDFDWCARAARISNKLVKAKTLSGEFRVDGMGLSAGANKRRDAENNIVYKRNNALNKLLPEDAALASQYRVSEMLHQGKWIIA